MTRIRLSDFGKDKTQRPASEESASYGYKNLRKFDKDREGLRGMDLDIDDPQDLPVNECGAIRCVFSRLETVGVGSGTTKRKAESKILYYVEELPERQFTVRPLNGKNVPMGMATVIDFDALVGEYAPELVYYEEQVLPAMEELEEYLDEGDGYREDGKLYSAEGSYSKALAIDERNVRALFSLGLIYLEMQDHGRARQIVGDLVNIRSTFEGKNQHLFNEFGISLRKNSLYAEAVDYYFRAAEYAPDDEHVHFNLARVNYERGCWEECGEALVRSLSLRPDLESSLKLGKAILTMHRHPERCEAQLKAPIPDAVARDVEKRVDMRLLPNNGKNVGHVVLGKS